ncbi:MAG TPA: hypothetical protein PLX88_09775 [Syntrophorhabdaceae bacterium]|nr:hypothetical protein [Syntrophorhabdaceae bacterium]HOS06530.1 hypothetical protein [Syntrophorhabdaceae bacterium]HPN98856.1 hypothetical protein [Syntrophorhabdaceae bacterium]
MIHCFIKAKGSRIRGVREAKGSRIRGVREAKGSRIRGVKGSSGSLGIFFKTKEARG